MHVYKKIVLLITLFFAAINFSYGQSYSISPNDTFSLVGNMEDMETLTISQVNKTKDTIYLEWQKISEIVPANWESSVCDNKICYTELVEKGTMNPVGPDEFGFILLHITPRVNFGTAVIRYAVWEKNNPVKDTLTFILKVSDVTGIKAKEKNCVFNVYPNPTSSHISVTSEMLRGFNYTLTDILGKEVLSGTSVQNANKVPVENLPNGIYNLKIIAGQEHIYNSKIIVQH